MGSTTDKATGLVNQGVGNLKQGLGKKLGSEQLHAEGVAQEAKGDAQKAAGEAKAAVKTAADTMANAVNKAL